MAKISVLIDTDIFIDALKGVKSAKELFKTKAIERYCSILSKKELLSKGGLRDSERKKILNMLAQVKVLRIDDDIHKKFFSLTKKYGNREDLFADYVIAATAWSKKLPLLTRNRRHFERIEEISLLPAYEGDN
ncbi:MAG: PIN domain-containing protein [Nitrospirota bacterium]|jgi:predicted nucleic acid-binding protein